MDLFSFVQDRQSLGIQPTEVQDIKAELAFLQLNEFEIDRRYGAITLNRFALVV